MASSGIFNAWSVDLDILEQCEKGDVAIELVKPIDLYSIWHARTIGRKLATTILRAVPILCICSIPILGEYALASPQNIQGFIFFVITLILSTLVLMAYLMLIYVYTMKYLSSKGVKTAFRLILETFSGAAIPIAFMPEIVVKILKLTPFFYMQNIPFNIYNGYITDYYEIFKIIIIQIIWLVLLTLLGRKLLRKQLKNVVVQGG